MPVFVDDPSVKLPRDYVMPMQCKRGHEMVGDNVYILTYPSGRKNVKCLRCKRENDTRNYQLRRQRGNIDDLRAESRAISTRHYLAHPGWASLRQSLLKFGLTLDQYYSMEDTQDFVCFLCYGLPDGERLVVDHNHVSGVVRKLLCRPCNTGLGQFRDNPDVLRRAAAYCEVL